ncbi:MAG TPA: hypothetical protein VKS22_17475 [Candidatus Binataceae bacterium]|nr:hypothetical protein [Candidatus Binataceae bacterium]
MVMAAGAGSHALAAPSGNMNLRTEGYELITPSGGATERIDVDAIGQVIADTSGNFTGAESFTGVNSALPPGSEVEDVCSGTLAGTITAPAGAFASDSGEFTLTSTYTPSSTSTGVSCIPSTVSMLCNRTLVVKKNANDLDAGQYHCLVTGVTAGSGATATIAGASLRGYIDSVSGSNAPTN